MKYKQLKSQFPLFTEYKKTVSQLAGKIGKNEEKQNRKR